MTLSPFDTRQVVPRPDAPKYPLNKDCAAPGCGRPATDNHHTFPKGMGWPKKSDYWWVQLPGFLVPVRVGFCREHHRQLTVHEARLVWRSNLGQYFWGTRCGEDDWTEERLADGALRGASMMSFGVPSVYPYVCPNCERPARFVTCDWCAGQCIRVGESPVGREDRLAAEGHA